MRSRPCDFRLFVAALLLAGTAVAEAGELGVNLYGLSYHFERDRAKAIGTDNEFNPGLGLRYRFADREHWTAFVDAGAYRDSGRNTAVLAGAALQWKATEALRLGGALSVFHSKSYNHGRTFVAPLPVASYELKSVTFNMVYMPKVHELNEINTLGFWVTFWPKGW
jgi:hypothetical protein